jgi:RNA polymerase sigma-70 factor (ECF subfamily)
MEDPRDEQPEERAAAGSDASKLAKLLRGLSGRERELVGLKYGAGLTNRAISELTGLSESNVGTILHRVVGRLRREWEA